MHLARSSYVAAAISAAVVYVLVPFGVAFAALVITAVDAPVAVLTALDAVAIVVWFDRSANWTAIGFGVRRVVVVGTTIVAVAALALAFIVHHAPAPVDPTSTAFEAAICAYLWYRAWSARRAARTPHDALSLVFPLRGGTFVVAHGGGKQLNHHWSFASQREALDIWAVDRFGFRSRGIAPAALDRYAVYGVEVVAPCDGVVTEARDGLPERPPGLLMVDQAYGNYVVIRRDDGIEISLAHLQSGSVLVREGDVVAAGQPIGRVGNSGHTSEPHLHIHADRDDEVGIPMTFDGRYLCRNDVVKA